MSSHSKIPIEAANKVRLFLRWGYNLWNKFAFGALGFCFLLFYLLMCGNTRKNLTQSETSNGFVWKKQTNKQK